MKSYLRTLLAMVLVGEAIALGQCYFAGVTLDEHVERLMRDCDAGRHREAYDRAAESLRRWTTFEMFRDYMQARKQAFGQYEGLGRARFGSSADTGVARRTRTASLKVELHFERRSKVCRFNFRKINGAWALVWFKIPLRSEKPLAERPPAAIPPSLDNPLHRPPVRR